MTDPNERLAWLELRVRELEGTLRGCKTDIRVLAVGLVLEPIFEADLPPEIYAYRAGRNAQQAVVEVEELLFRGHPDVVDADLADYFGSIPHTELLKSVARRIVDRRVLHLTLTMKLYSRARAKIPFA